MVGSCFLPVMVQTHQLWRLRILTNEYVVFDLSSMNRTLRTGVSSTEKPTPPSAPPRLAPVARDNSPSISLLCLILLVFVFFFLIYLFWLFVLIREMLLEIAASLPCFTFCVLWPTLCHCMTWAVLCSETVFGLQLQIYKISLTKTSIHFLHFIAWIVR